MVKWLQSLFARPPGLQLVPDAIPAPWAHDRPAIHARIAACELTADGSLPDAIFPLPGKSAHASVAQYTPGELDGEPEHAPSTRDLAQAHDLSSALRAAATDHTVDRLVKLYDTILAATPAGMAASLGTLAHAPAHAESTAILARWLARKAPDPIAVRYAIALLGQYGEADDADLILTLGRHEEFTVTCATALCKLLGSEQAQTAMWNLARRVHGWGRIHIVRRLAGTGCPEIQQWLLRDGYRNRYNANYLACRCAIGGKLLEALQSGAVDERLLTGAADILHALLSAGLDGRPSRHMHDYPDGAAASLAFLACVGHQRPRQLRVAAAVIALADIANHELPWGNTTSQQIAKLAGHILTFDYWPALVREQLAGDDTASRLAATLAPSFGVGLGGQQCAAAMQANTRSGT